MTLDLATLLYTYISRFSVNPHYQQREKIRQSCRHKFYPQPFLVAFFNFSHKRPTFAFTGESGYTHSAFGERWLTGRNRGVSDGGAVTTLGPFCTVRKPCVAGRQNGVLCRFWVLVGCAPEERREPAGQRHAHARRCSEASRPRWAAQLCCRCSLSMIWRDRKT